MATKQEEEPTLTPRNGVAAETSMILTPTNGLTPHSRSILPRLSQTRKQEKGLPQSQRSRLFNRLSADVLAHLDTPTNPLSYRAESIGVSRLLYRSPSSDLLVLQRLYQGLVGSD